MNVQPKGRFTRHADPPAYERRPGSDGQWIEHLDGTEWSSARAPSWRHRCWPQTRSWLNGELAERCACGSIRFDGYGPWVRRNERKPAGRQLTMGVASVAAVAVFAFAVAALLIILGLVP